MMQWCIVSSRGAKFWEGLVFGKRIIAASALVVATTIGANAQTATPSFDWSGPYVGVVGGHGWFYKIWDWAVDNGEPIDPVPMAAHTAVGLLAGIEGGYRFQTNVAVLGVEIDLAWTNSIGGGTCLGLWDATECETDLDWLATLTGQVGIGAGGFLVYAEAGLAIARETLNTYRPTLLDTTGVFTNFGLVVGAGLVVGTPSGWLIKAEYNYLNFGTVAVTLERLSNDNNYGVDLTQHAHTIKIGIGRRF